MKRILAISVAICLLPLSPIWSLAEETEEKTAPSTELLEFLGTFEDKDEGWIDPFEFLDTDKKEFAELPSDKGDADE
ncbi:MAG: hypothetical protein JW773_13145 [Desulfuromonadales bacterium]|nr:hypothetical protein [Desulfuromonadales bacterium]